MPGNLRDVGLVYKVSRNGDRGLLILHFVRRALRDEQGLTGTQNNLATTEIRKICKKKLIILFKKKSLLLN